MANSRKRTNVISLSFDGCVYHPQYDFKFMGEENPFAGQPNDDLDRLRLTNQVLIQHIAQDIHAGQFQKVMMMVGCRQDAATEQANIKKHKRGSCIQDLPELMYDIQERAASLNPGAPQPSFDIDRYLLADSYAILSNFDFANPATQDAIKYYESTGKIAADNADAALEESVQANTNLVTIKRDIEELKHAIKKEKSYILKLEKEARLEELEKQIPLTAAKIAKLTEVEKTQREESMQCREKVKMFRGTPFGYGVKANMNPAVVELRQKISLLRKRASDSQWEVENSKVGIAVGMQAQLKRDAWNYEAFNLQYESSVYMYAMQIGSTWHSIFLALEIERLRNNAQECEPHIRHYQDEDQKIQNEIAKEAKLADVSDYEARQALAAGDNAKSDEMYANANQHEKNIEELKAQKNLYLNEIKNIKQRAQDLLDQANLLCLGPKAATYYVPGVSPRQAIIDSGNNPDITQANVFKPMTCFVDDSKLTLLYAQLQRAAAENPNNEVVFDFYEGQHNILIGLAHFFKNNRDLIPDNLTLRLHHYAGAAPMLIKQIVGLGPIDYNYHHNVSVMIETAGFKFIYNQPGDAPTKPTDDCRDVGVLVGFWVEKNLKAFKQQRQFFADTIEHWMKPCFLGTFDPKIYLGELYKDIKNFPEDLQYQPLKNALALLYEALEKDFIEKVRKGMTPKRIEKSTAYEMVTLTKKFLTEFNDPANDAARADITANFVQSYQKMTRLREAGKVIAVILAAIAGMIIGAALGIAIGFAAGLISGPGAVVTGLFGMLAGAAAGTIAAIAGGALVTGVGCGIAAKLTLFGVRPDDKSIAMKNVIREGKEYAAHAQRDESMEVSRLAPAL